MKFKKLFLIIAAVIAISAFDMTAFAQSQAESEITITFEPYSGITEPLDPDNPQALLSPAGQGTGAPGPLSVDYIPTLTLGDVIQLATFEKTYSITTDRAFMQATDLRGTGGGWSVRVNLSEFADADNSTLPGASLRFSNGSAISPNMAVAEPAISQNAVAYAGGSAVTLVTAGDEEGKGTWLARWYDAEGSTAGKIELVVPGGIAKIGAYTATINWQLMDVI